MRRLFVGERFVEFGKSRFVPARHQFEVTRVTSGRIGRIGRLREAVRGDCPRVPGIYGMLDRDGELIYIGKAKCLRSRLLSYFRENSRLPKAGRIIQQTRVLLWERATSEFAALLRELELIRRFLPRFNVQGKPGFQRYCYLCLGRSPAPYAYVSRRLTGKEVAIYGPLVGRSPANEAARRINDHFRLRDCSQRQPLAFADQPELFPIARSPGCLRVEIDTCSGACVGGCSAREYQRQVELAQSFLDGRDRHTLDTLEREMNEAAASEQFERAAALRDKVLALQWISERLRWLGDARDKHSFIYPLKGVTGSTWWYLIHRGQIHAVVPAPRTVKQREHTARLIRQIFKKGTPIGSPLPANEVDSVLLVAAWFRKHPEEREQLLSKEQALGKLRIQG